MSTVLAPFAPPLTLTALEDCQSPCPCPPCSGRVHGFIATMEPPSDRQHEPASPLVVRAATPGNCRSDPQLQHTQTLRRVRCRLCRMKGRGLRLCIRLSGREVSQLALLGTRHPTLERRFVSSPYRQGSPSPALQSLLYPNSSHRVPPLSLLFRAGSPFLVIPQSVTGSPQGGLWPRSARA